MERGDEFAEGKPLREGREGVDVLREALAAVTIFAVGTGHLGVHLVDVTREENTGVDGLVVAAVAAAVVGHGIEVGHLERTEDIVGILRDFGLEGGHAAEFLADENLAEEINLTGEDHRLRLEILDVSALGEEFGHEVNFVPRLFGEPLGGARKDGRTDEDRHVGKALDELGHQGQILRTVILGRYVERHEDNVRRGQVVIHPFGRVTDQHLHVGIVFLQPHL